ncbi:MAG: Flp pilus assembly complex ATPase component TadA, partial [Gammaproteobacteria bacterium]|nr:Flp pilus assembly complex ATPase component TadA [Gammaproteobacteria bacterium]
MSERTDRLHRKLETELGPVVRNALADAEVVEVDINPDGQIWVDRHGVDLAMIGVMGPQVVMSLICTVAAMSDRVVTPTAPILEATLPDGSRFHATIPPITTAPAIAIRKHLSQALTLDDYVRQGVMTREQCERLRRAVAHRENIIVA